MAKAKATVDISQDLGASIGDVTAVVTAARRLRKLELEIEQLQATIDTKQEEYNRLSTDELPALMDSVGIAGLPLQNGYTLTLKDIFRASLPAKSTIEKADTEERPQLLARFNTGIRWLRQHKAADLIKNTLRIDLGRGQEATAREFVALARQYKVSVDRSQTVHPAALAKFLKEKLAMGTDVPLETFNVFDGREAEVKAPKAPKEKK